MANGNGVLIDWIGAGLSGLFLMMVGGVVKLIRLSERVRRLEDDQSICKQTNAAVIELRTEVDDIKVHQKEARDSTKEIFGALQDIRDRLPRKVDGP